MPHDKKKKMQQPGKAKKAGLASANNYFETAEELANRHPEAKERQGKSHQAHQATENPEQPNP